MAKNYEIRGGERLAIFTKNLLAASDYEINFGFLRPDRYPDNQGLRVSDVARMQEYGTEHIPARPFMRPALNSLRQMFPQHIRKRIDKKKMYIDQDLATELGQLGRERIRQQIRWTKDPPNAPSTIARKGHGNPLIDTRHMINKVRYEVKKKRARNAS